MGTAPWLHRAFLGDSLQHLRPGEPQGRLTDRLAGFWSGKSSVLGPSEPCNSWALPEPLCAAAVAASRPPPSLRGAGAAGGCWTSGAQSGPPAPSCDVRGEKWLKELAEDAHAKQHVEKRGRRGVWGGKMPYPLHLTRSFSATLRVETS